MSHVSAHPISHCPFIPDHLSKDVCIAGTLGTQSYRVPPRQRADCILPSIVKIMSPLEQGTGMLTARCKRGIFPKPGGAAVSAVMVTTE